MGVSVNAKPLRVCSHLPKPLGPLLPMWLLWSNPFFLIKWWESREMIQCVTVNFGADAPWLFLTAV